MSLARVCRGQSKSRVLIDGAPAVKDKMDFALWGGEMDGGIEKTRIGHGVYHTLCIVIYGVRMAKEFSFCTYIWVDLTLFYIR